jgi:putative transcriptional regulator
LEAEKGVADELEQFQTDLLESVRQMKSGRASSMTEVSLSASPEAQQSADVSHSVFESFGFVVTGKK